MKSWILFYAAAMAKLRANTYRICFVLHDTRIQAVPIIINNSGGISYQSSVLAFKLAREIKKKMRKRESECLNCAIAFEMRIKNYQLKLTRSMNNGFFLHCGLRTEILGGMTSTPGACVHVSVGVCVCVRKHLYWKNMKYLSSARLQCH